MHHPHLKTGATAGSSIKKPTRWLQLFVIIVLGILVLRTLRQLGSASASSASILGDSSSGNDAAANRRRHLTLRKNALMSSSSSTMDKDSLKKLQADEKSNSAWRKIDNDNDGGRKKQKKQQMNGGGGEGNGDDDSFVKVRNFVLFSSLRRAAAHRELGNRACFSSLVRHSRDGLTKFARLLKNVRENLPLMAERYPFVAFVEDEANTDDVTALINELSGFRKYHKSGGRHPLMHVFPAGVIIAQVPKSDFGEIPSFIRSGSWPYPQHSYWGVSYRHMCRFFGVKVMYQEALNQFDYFMRLDTDSFVLERPRTTVFVPNLRHVQEGAFSSSLSSSSEEEKQNKRRGDETGNNNNNNKNSKHGSGSSSQKKGAEEEHDHHHDGGKERQEDKQQQQQQQQPQEEHRNADALEAPSFSSKKIWHGIDPHFLAKAQQWIRMAHGIPHIIGSDKKKKQHNNNENNNDEGNNNDYDGDAADEANNNNNRLASHFIEEACDVDLFLDMAAADSKYAFTMLHHQTLPQFLTGLFEAYDDFFSKEVKEEAKLNEDEFDKYRVMRLATDELPDLGVVFVDDNNNKQEQRMQKNKNKHPHHHYSGDNRRSLQHGITGPELFGAPRGIGLHYWDNFEIVDLRIFRRIDPTAGNNNNKNEVERVDNIDLNADDDHHHAAAPVRIPTMTGMRLHLRRALLLHNKNRQQHHSSDGGDDQLKLFLFGGKKQREAETLRIEKHNLRANAILRFLNHMDHAGGFYYYRWGDAEMRTMLVTLFLPSTEVAYANSLPYQHYHNYHCARGTGSSLPFARERMDDLRAIAAEQQQQQQEQQSGGGGGGGRNSDWKVISKYLQDLELLPPSSMNQDDEFINHVLGTPTMSSGYRVAKALTAIASFVSDKRGRIVRDLRGSCETNAMRKGENLLMANGKKADAYKGKGHGSAHMLPAEHDSNNNFFWGHAKQQIDGFLPL